jgi:hypothetical protein
MAGDQKNPAQTTIVVTYGELQGEGMLTGLTIAEAKAFIIKHAPDLALPPDASATVMTMDTAAEAWKAVTSAEKVGILTKKADWGLQILQGASKDVPDDYVIRAADIHLSFTAPLDKAA